MGNETKLPSTGNTYRVISTDPSLRITHVEDDGLNTLTIKYIVVPTPQFEIIVDKEWQEVREVTCRNCGIDLTKATGYVCGNTNCPYQTIVTSKS